MIHLFYLLFIITFMALGTIGLSLQEDTITECKQKHEATKVELYNLNQKIAQGLCLPCLKGIK